LLKLRIGSWSLKISGPQNIVPNFVKVLTRELLVISCLLCLLVISTGCIAPPWTTFVDPSEYSDNPIDKALGAKPQMPFADAIASNLRERFPLGSNVNDFTEYLLSIGSQCDSTGKEAGSVVHCTYEKRRRFTQYKKEGFFFPTRGAPIGEGSYRDHVDIIFGPPAGVLKTLSVDYHGHSIGAGTEGS